jgi:hypothetical protein
MPSKFEVVGTLQSLARFLESIKYRASALDLTFDRTARIATAGLPERRCPAGHRAHIVAEHAGHRAGATGTAVTTPPCE